MVKSSVSCLLICIIILFTGCEKFESDSNAVIKGKAIPASGFEDGSFMDIYLYAKANCNSAPVPSSYDSYYRYALTDSLANFSFTNLPRGDYLLNIYSSFNDTGGIINDTVGTYSWYGYTCIQINGGDEIVNADIVFTETFRGIDTSVTSCPYLYSYEDSSFLFRGEIYSGAVYKSLQRDDYMMLDQLKSCDNKIFLKLSNERNEIHYTDQTQLIFIENIPGTRNFMDRRGHLQTISSLQKPKKVTANGLFDVKNMLIETDQRYYRFNDERKYKPESFLESMVREIKEFFWIEDKTSMQELTMEFKKPRGVNSAKLYISAKNPAWVSYFYFNSLMRAFGTHLPKWIEKQNNASPEDQTEWAFEQGTPLSVYLKTKEGWTFVDYFNPVGGRGKFPREMVMPVDLSKAEGESIQIRLECGFNFWEVDCAALDYSANSTVKIYRYSPAEITSDIGKSLTDKVLKKDNQYLTMKKGENAVLTFSCPPSYTPGKYSAIFFSNGYYNLDQSFPNDPDWLSLIRFNRPGSYTNSARLHYQSLFTNRHVGNHFKSESH